MPHPGLLAGLKAVEVGLGFGERGKDLSRVAGEPVEFLSQDLDLRRRVIRNRHRLDQDSIFGRGDLDVVLFLKAKLLEHLAGKGNLPPAQKLSENRFGHGS